MVASDPAPNVGSFLDHREARATSEEAGAKEAHAALIRSGLPSETVARVRPLLVSVVGVRRGQQRDGEARECAPQAGGLPDVAALVRGLG